MIGYFIWDPPKEVFPWNVPLLDRPILWYGVLFALGFFLGYLVFCSLVRTHVGSAKKANQIAEQFLLYVGVGAIIGARLGDVLFYQDPQKWLQNPLEILYFWEGGLSSHGAAVGILIALLLLTWHLKKKTHDPHFTFLKILDYTVIPTALAGCCIRIGNFINQEILGTPTDVPWAILFLHPADGGPIVPRHPAQLYESIAYLVIFFVLYFCYKKRKFFQKDGKSSGLFLILIFGFRFFVEFIKEEQSVSLGAFPLTMGQLLSIPLVLWGVYLLTRKNTVK